MKNLRSEDQPVYTQKPVDLWDHDLVDRALLHVNEMFRRGEQLTNPGAVKQWIQLQLCREQREVFGLLLLDSQHRIIANEHLFHGTIDGASVYPREVVKACLYANAAAVIFYHNHPSGFAEPSDDDIKITARLKDALKLIEVRVLDHLVTAGDRCVSLAERGLI